MFEINRNFRNEGISTIHNPEFTMLEFYQAYADDRDLMALTEDLFGRLARDLLATTTLAYQGHEIDLAPPWRRVPYVEAILEHNAFERSVLEDQEAATAAARGLGLEIPTVASLSGILNVIFEETVEPRLIQPTFITDYPTDLSPLARRKDADPRFTDRFELFIAGRELANGFSELNDRSTSADVSKPRRRNGKPATTKPTTWMKISCAPWNTGCRRPRERALASTGW